LRNKRLVRVGAAAGFALTIAFTPSADATHSPSKREITAQFGKWNAALATHDPAKVADLYAPGAVLLPTLSNVVRTDRAGLIDYFEEFLAKNPKGTLTQEIVTVLDDNTAINTGVYRFDLTVDGQPSAVDARYTFVYEKRHGRWLITNHHSSAMPTPA
jgi:uncharacterized protein (TIGR02246 family)